MAHFIFKKPLQNEKVRAKYVDEHRELKNLKNSGALDIDTYRNAKRCIEESLMDNALGLEPRSSPRKSGSVRSSGASSRSSSSDSVGPPLTATKSRKGTIFDRGNVAARMFLADAQTEEQRRALKLEKKLEERIKADAQLAALSLEDSFAFEVPFHNMYRRTSETSYVTSNRSSSISSGSGQRPPNGPKLSFFSKRPASSRGKAMIPSPVIREGFEFNHSPQPLSTPGTPPLLSAPSPLLASPVSPTLNSTTADTSWGGYGTGSEWSRLRARGNSIGTVSSIPTLSRKGSVGSLAAPSVPPLPSTGTWADKWLLGGTRTTGSKITVDQQYARSILSRGNNRRHSFSSQGRPSFGSDESRRMSELATVASMLRGESPFPSNPSQASLPYGLSNGYDEAHYTPPSMLLLDMFAALLNGFDSTSKLFDYARKDTPRDYHSSKASSVTESMYHPGKLVILDEEVEKLKDTVKGRLWFLMTLKWQYFGRVLFSPGHHLLQLGKAGYGSRPSTADELRILDLDGPMTADWAWQCAYEYPDAIVYSLTTSTNQDAISPLTTEFMPPPNQRRVQVSSMTDLSSLPSHSFDAISSRNISRYIKKSEWLPVLRECHRLLKHDGYIEFTVLDPVLNDMGPITRQWIIDNILKDDHPRMFDIMPSKTVLKTFAEAGFGDISKMWAWVPVTSIGDELSTLTSKMGRYLYDELYGPCEGGEDAEVERPREHVELGLWKDEKILEECLKSNTAFRWLKCHAKKMELADL